MLIQRAKKKRFNIIRGKVELSTLIDRLPGENECFKFISTGGFSSICFILFVAEIAKIKELHVSTFAVGKKEILTLHSLRKAGRLDKCTFQTFTLMKDGNTKQYWEIFQQICEANNWRILNKRNHSKVILLDTDAGKFVIETSSNLNENPKIEQFSFEADAALYDFYLNNLFTDEGLIE